MTILSLRRPYAPHVAYIYYIYDIYCILFDDDVNDSTHEEGLVDGVSVTERQYALNIDNIPGTVYLGQVRNKK